MSSANSLLGSHRESENGLPRPRRRRSFDSGMHDAPSTVADNDSMDMGDSTNPLSLDGYLMVRRGRSSGHSTLLSRKRFVSLAFANGGSLKVFKDFPGTHTLMLESHPSSSMLQSMYSKLHRGLSHAIAMRKMDGLDLYIPANVPWVAKDVENDTASFVIEIPVSLETIEDLELMLSGRSSEASETEEPMNVESPLDESEGVDSGATGTTSGSLSRRMSHSAHYHHDSSHPEEDDDEDEEQASLVSGLSVPSCNNHRDQQEGFVQDLLAELKQAQKKGKPFRVYFRCMRGSHEKALWLKAFSKLGRLSTEYRKKKTLLSALTSPLHIQSTKIIPHARVRTRRSSMVGLAREVRDLDLQGDDHDAESVDDGITLTNDVEKLVRRITNPRIIRDREYRVVPSYAYPHRWMTRSEMQEEMILPSETFHDLRVEGCKEKEIGTLRVEVLQCISLPKLDRTSDTDAVAYLVCGSYAFATDVIPNRANPVWLRKSRRACEFPLFHGFARLFVGVFDDSGNREKDDFAGRVVIDLARLRPNSTYDVTLPLRLSTHVYSRRKRGAIRLRFTLKWQSERAALLSYIPKSLKVPLPQNSKPNFDTTVNCSDQKAFRNIAITVHGAHLPGRFTFHQMRACIREMNFTRRYIFQSILMGYRDLRHWRHPITSGFMFVAWMHCIYANAFSLVPAYAVLSFLLFLIRNYAKFCVQSSMKSGFVPPSWEEMMLALTRGGYQDCHAIQPLELGHRLAARSRRMQTLTTSSGMIEHRDFKTKTHEPRGMALFRALGFVPKDEEGNVQEVPHLEFPYADAIVDYPKFGVKECLVTRKGDNEVEASAMSTSNNGYTADDQEAVVENSESFRLMRGFDMPQFPIDLHLQDVLRKDSSGLKEYDEEENKFTAKRAVVATGKRAAKKVKKKGVRAATAVTEAATKTGMKVGSNLKTAATELTEMTGLNHVVEPIKNEISKTSALVSNGMNQVANQVVTPIRDQVVTPIREEISKTPARVSSGVRMVSNQIHFPARPGLVRRANTTEGPLVRLPSQRPRLRQRSYSSDDIGPHSAMYTESGTSLSAFSYTSNGSKTGGFPETVETGSLPSVSPVKSPRQEEQNGEPVIPWPEQNIDVEGPSTGKKLTEDLDDIKDKVHELLWHRFDDHAYVIKNPEAIYFGDAKRPEKRRKDVKKSLDKLLHIGQYSHSNPFVARVGLYVEPIVGSLYSFLCLFRAGFNVFTWQDPMLTFWVSVVSGLLSLVLFFFPWRQFLFVLGFWLVGPQNWVIRILRERGHLPPLKKRPPVDKSVIDTSEDRLTRQPIFSSGQRTQKNEPDPREVHSVAVPYSPLMYQRFYDWPPEPIFAQVKPDTEEARRQRALSSLQRVSESASPSLVAGSGALYQSSRQLFRNRFQRDRSGISLLGNSSRGRPPTYPTRRRAYTEESSTSRQYPRRRPQHSEDDGSSRSPPPASNYRRPANPLDNDDSSSRLGHYFVKMQ